MTGMWGHLHPIIGEEEGKIGMWDTCIQLGEGKLLDNKVKDHY